MYTRHARLQRHVSARRLIRSQNRVFLNSVTNLNEPLIIISIGYPFTGTFKCINDLVCLNTCPYMRTALTFLKRLAITCLFTKALQWPESKYLVAYIHRIKLPKLTQRTSFSVLLEVKGFKRTCCRSASHKVYKFDMYFQTLVIL